MRMLVNHTNCKDCNKEWICESLNRAKIGEFGAHNSKITNKRTAKKQAENQCQSSSSSGERAEGAGFVRSLQIPFNKSMVQNVIKRAGWWLCGPFLCCCRQFFKLTNKSGKKWSVMIEDGGRMIFDVILIRKNNYNKSKNIWCTSWEIELAAAILTRTKIEKVA